MSSTKKLVFAIPFLLTMAYFWYNVNPLLTSTNFLFSFSLQTLIQLVIISGSLLLASTFFVVFATLSQDWKYVGPVAVVSGVLPFLLLSSESAIFLAIGSTLALALVYAMLGNKLKTYLTFQPIVLLHPSIKNIATLVILVLSITSFFTLGATVNEQGIKMFDPLVDQSLTIVKQLYSQDNPEAQDTDALVKQQIDQLKQNPQLLASYGIKPSDLNNPTIIAALKDRLVQATTSKADQDEAVKGVVQTMLKPYLGFIPAILAITIFLTLSTFNGVLAFFSAFLLWAIFYMLRETKFIKFSTEMREVKKLVV